MRNNNPASVKYSLLAIALLIGTTIGGGIFGLPYVVSKAGIIIGLFYFLILGGAALLVHLFLAETVLRTRKKQRLVGYAKTYLGSRGKLLITFSTITGTIGVLLAYIIAGGSFLKIVASSFVNWPSFYFNLAFWLICSFFLIFGIKAISRIEVLTNLIFFAVILFILSLCLPNINPQYLPLINREHVFLPFGVILFAFAGWNAIPEIGELLKTRNQRRKIKGIIIVTALIITIFYILFATILAGVSGPSTSTQALSGLVPFLGKKIIFWGALAGAITLADSFLAIGLYLTNTLVYDFGFRKTLALFCSSFLPLFLFLVILGAIEGVSIILIFKKAKQLGDRKPEFKLNVPNSLLYALAGLFLAGAAAQLIYFIK